MFRSLIYNYNVILIFFVIIPSKNLPKKFYQDFILEGKVEKYETTTQEILILSLGLKSDSRDLRSRVLKLCFHFL